MTVRSPVMTTLPEYVGNVHIILGPYRGNPISLYLTRTDRTCRIAPRVYPWNDTFGEGETPNKAAADFEERWKAKGLAADMYTGPHWDGVKPEKPAPPKPAAKPAAPAAAAGQPAATQAQPANSPRPAGVTSPATSSASASASAPSPTPPAQTPRQPTSAPAAPADGPTPTDQAPAPETDPGSDKPPVSAAVESHHADSNNR
ncbi:MAG: hypothetical protein ACREI3_04580 [Nitrospirales bacterium]